jgi:hypothetical protein
VVASVQLVEVDEVGVGLLGPAPRRLVELSKEDADGGGTVTPLTWKKPSVFSQYRRPEEILVFVTKVIVMTSSCVSFSCGISTWNGRIDASPDAEAT